MHSTQHNLKGPTMNFGCSGKLITLLPCPTPTLQKSKKNGSKRQQEQQIWENGRERDLPTVQGKKVLMTTNFQRNGCPCEVWKRKLKVIKQPKGHSFVSTPHCELVAKGSDWWIRDLKSARGTFVNGIKLSENGEKKLHNMDIISLGVSHTDPEILNFVERDSDDNDDGDIDDDDEENYCKGAPHIIYRYKAPTLRNTDRNEDVANESNNVAKLKVKSRLRKSVIKNEVILSSILGKLPVADLKNARLVCKKWRNVSTTWLYSSTRVDIPGVDCPHWPFLKDNYDSYFKGKKIENVSLDFDKTSMSISLTESFIESQEKEWEVKGELYLKNVQWFLKSFGRGIKSFKLNFDIQRDTWSLFLRILKKLKTVKDLQLSFVSALSLAQLLEEVKFPEEMPKLCSVKSFSIQINDDKWNFRKKFEPLIVGLLKIFPSVEKLTFPEPNYEGALKICTDIIKDNAILIPKVKDLSITFEEDFHVKETVEILKEIPFVNKLRSLELENLTDSHCGGTIFNLVMSLLKKIASNLEILVLGFRDSNTFINSLMEVRGGFPEFPQLWRLKILTINDEALPGLSNYRGVNYDTVFPNLKSLKFGGVISNRFAKCHLQHFLRMENNPCRTVVEFELSISTIQKEPVELRKRIMEKFPNVDFPNIKFSLKEETYDAPRRLYEVYDGEFFNGSEYSKSDSSECSEVDDDYEDDDYFYHDDELWWGAYDYFDYYS